MTGFEVDPQVLRAAADAAKQAAGVVGRLHLGRVPDLATPLPGTESARTAVEHAPPWDGAPGNWAKGMDSYASALTKAAGEYQAREGATAQGFRGTGR